MLLSAKLLLSYQRCQRQAFLDVYADRSQKAPPSDFLNKLRQDRIELQRHFFTTETGVGAEPKYPTGDWQAGAEATLAFMESGAPSIRLGVLLTQPIDGVVYFSNPDLLTKIPGQSVFGDWLYVPTDIRLSKRPKLEYQILATFHAFLLASVQGTWPEVAYLYLPEQGTYPVNLPRLQPKLDKMLCDLLSILRDRLEPEVFIVHNRCNLCGWLPHCYQLAQQDQHLSLLPGVTPSRYPLLQSHHLTRVEDIAKADPVDLAQIMDLGKEVAFKLVCQAQSFTTQAPILIAQDSPTATSQLISPAPIELYFDIEAEPSLNLDYLHGVLVIDREHQTQTFHSLLADCPEQEEQIWWQFLELALSYPQAPIYHFCPYEVQAIERLAVLYGTPDTLSQELIGRFIDIHALVTRTVVLPVERYTLKLIARWLGFQWRNSEANGAQSIYWYSEWLATGNHHFLETIADYNEDDCQATFHIKNWLVNFLAPENSLTSLVDE
ncbi:MAG: TM0106 family RecB-like putative nuclease [Acaryochloris sp. RU_4_1]|nr:TM0106 family RecB-like putative nuclease [Acaryochloris sp. SU_5_25]NJM65882.1 TM0106 family RecB-like putative nuclease [Acaryochloris sp. RU_4_1]NJN37705.1 TM0106 family RecB-like putative nuclease [Acaryochloridaceae cyanobacterium CSU_3_4]NJR56552.1 TM0106 family RecB-like putative nuclease [Acaryochloris sp. CRU_2_0]